MKKFAKLLVLPILVLTCGAVLSACGDRTTQGDSERLAFLTKFQNSTTYSARITIYYERPSDKISDPYKEAKMTIGRIGDIIRVKTEITDKNIPSSGGGSTSNTLATETIIFAPDGRYTLGADNNYTHAEALSTANTAVASLVGAILYETKFERGNCGWIGDDTTSGRGGKWEENDNRLKNLGAFTLSSTLFKEFGIMSTNKYQNIDGIEYYLDSKSSSPFALPEKATVSLNYNDKENPTVNEQQLYPWQKPTKPTDPERPLHTFLGWFDQKTGGEKFVFDRHYTDNTTAYARWHQKTENELMVDYAGSWKLSGVSGTGSQGLFVAGDIELKLKGDGTFNRETDVIYNPDKALLNTFFTVMSTADIWSVVIDDGQAFIQITESGKAIIPNQYRVVSSGTNTLVLCGGTGNWTYTFNKA